jgi:hypothetical protein
VTGVTRCGRGDKLSGEGIPRITAARYSAESSMRSGAFDVRENLRCKSCRD